MKTLVVADAHLKATAGGESGRACFQAFLEGIADKGYRRIVILGDLFDFWFEYRYVIFSGYFGVLRSLARLTDAGIETHLVCGNHDFWAGSFLRDEIGIQIHHGPLVLDSPGRRVMFVHGDGVNRGDYGYRVYKWFARSRFAVTMFGLIHPDLAMRIAQGVSHGSRSLKSPDHPGRGGEIAPVRQFALAALERGEADVIVCAHTHYPECVEVQTPRGPSRYINTGDWMHHRTFLEWDGDEFTRFQYRDSDGAWLPAPMSSDEGASFRGAAIPVTSPGHTG